MKGKKRIGLRSIGQPRAAVLTLCLGIFWRSSDLCSCDGGAKAQSGAASADDECSEDDGAGIQKHPSPQRDPAGSIDSGDAIHYGVVGRGVRVLPCEGCIREDDKKTKQTARKMMEMMFAINKDNFEAIAK